MRPSASIRKRPWYSPGSPGDKVRRYLSREFDNLYLFSQPGDIDLSAVQRLVLVGTRQAGQLGSLAACLGNPGLELHVYDHHPSHEGDIRAQVEHVAPYGATSTLMVRLIRGQHLVLTPWEATLMALGIYDSTGAFLAPGTNREDLRTMEKMDIPNSLSNLMKTAIMIYEK